VSDIYFSLFSAVIITKYLLYKLFDQFINLL
jgi:hypothetical protein